jgi:hypothetical protein
VGTGGFRISSLALTALAALPAPAAAGDLCASLNRIIASSRETPPFASVRRGLTNGEAIVPGFAATICEVSATTGIHCSDASMNVGNFDDWPDLGACLGVEALPEPSPRPFRRDWTKAFAVSGLRIEYGVECLRCAGPASSLFSVTFEGRARTEE